MESLTQDKEKVSILFLDDDIFFLQEIKNQAQKVKWITCSVAQTIPSAKKICLKKHFDLIFIDFNLSYESGYEFFSWLKKNKILSQIIFISGFFQNAKIEEKSLSLIKAYDFLKKPISWQALKLRIFRFYQENKKRIIRKNFDNLKIYFDDLNHEIFFQDKILKLTKKQYKVLKHLFENSNKILSRNDLSKLFNENYVKTSRSIDVFNF